MTKKMFIAVALLALAAGTAKADTVLLDVRGAASRIVNAVKGQLKRPSWTYDPADYVCAQEGENGVVCRAKKTAAIKCLKGHDEKRVEGEMGEVTRFVCEQWDPPTGFGGSPRGDDAPQAP